VRYRLLAVGTVVRGVKDRLVAVGTAAGKDKTAIGTDLGSGEEFHLAARASKSECQFTVGAIFDGFVVIIGFTHGGTATRAQRLPASGTGRITQIDPSITMGTDHRLPRLCRRIVELFRFTCYLIGLGGALKNKATMGAKLIVRRDVAIAARTPQCPGCAAYRADGVVRPDEGTAVWAQIGVAVGTEICSRFDSFVAVRAAEEA
jgi:hypothetical protein